MDHETALAIKARDPERWADVAAALGVQSPSEAQHLSQNLDDAIDLLARIRHLDLLPEDDRYGDLAHDVDAFIELMDEHNHIGAAPRCGVCGRLTEIESWDTPVEYCPNDCDGATDA